MTALSGCVHLGADQPLPQPTNPSLALKAPYSLSTEEEKALKTAGLRRQKRDTSVYYRERQAQKQEEDSRLLKRMFLHLSADF